MKEFLEIIYITILLLSIIIGISTTIILSLILIIDTFRKKKNSLFLQERLKKEVESDSCDLIDEKNFKKYNELFNQILMKRPLIKWRYSNFWWYLKNVNFYSKIEEKRDFIVYDEKTQKKLLGLYEFVLEKQTLDTIDYINTDKKFKFFKEIIRFIINLKK